MCMGKGYDVKRKENVLRLSFYQDCLTGGKGSSHVDEKIQPGPGGTGTQMGIFGYRECTSIFNPYLMTSSYNMCFNLRLGLDLQQVQPIRYTFMSSAAHARQSFDFQKITGILKMSIFVENLQIQYLDFRVGNSLIRSDRSSQMSDCE